MTPFVLRSISLALLAGSFCTTRAQAPPAASAPPPMFVRQGARLDVPAGSPLRDRLQVVAVTASTAAPELVLPASVEADPARSVNIVAPLAGRLTSLGVQLGDTVRRGRVLATIASPDMAQAQADLARARDAQDLAQRALVRAQGVNQTGANAAKDVETAQSTLVQQAAEAARAEARLKVLGARAENFAKNDSASASANPPAAITASMPMGTSLALTAPFGGIVIALNVGAGAWLSDTTAPLMTIANLDRVWVTANVPENALGRIAAGQPATVTLAALPGRRFDGRVAFVSPVLDADTRRARARIVFANADHALKPNLFASVAFALAGPAEPEVPASALLMNNDRVSVFVETAPWRFERRTVELGREDGERVRIVRGLRVGERVVARGGVLLND